MSKEDGQVYAKAIRLLTQREHTRKELLYKLNCNDSFCEQVINDVLSRLETEGYLSETRFICSFVRSSIHRGHGPIRIQNGLKGKGITSSLAQEGIHKQDLDWNEHAKAVLQKKFGGEPPKDIKERAKQTRFLLSRGFSNEHVRHAFRNI